MKIPLVVLTLSMFVFSAGALAFRSNAKPRDIGTEALKAVEASYGIDQYGAIVGFQLGTDQFGNPIRLVTIETSAMRCIYARSIVVTDASLRNEMAKGSLSCSPK